MLGNDTVVSHDTHVYVVFSESHEDTVKEHCPGQVLVERVYNAQEPPELVCTLVIFSNEHKCLLAPQSDIHDYVAEEKRLNPNRTSKQCVTAATQV